VRADVAMVATKVSRSGRVLKLLLDRASGELDVKIWRDKDGKPDTIKMRARGEWGKERLEEKGEARRFERTDMTKLRLL
jgi:hypothetical protein